MERYCATLGEQKIYSGGRLLDDNSATLGSLHVPPNSRIKIVIDRTHRVCHHLTKCDVMSSSLFDLAD